MERPYFHGSLQKQWSSKKKGLLYYMQNYNPRAHSGYMYMYLTLLENSRVDSTVITQFCVGITQR